MLAGSCPDSTVPRGTLSERSADFHLPGVESLGDGGGGGTRALVSTQPRAQIPTITRRRIPMRVRADARLFRSFAGPLVVGGDELQSARHQRFAILYAILGHFDNAFGSNLAHGSRIGGPCLSAGGLPEAFP